MTDSSVIVTDPMRRNIGGGTSEVTGPTTGVSAASVLLRNAASEGIGSTGGTVSSTGVEVVSVAAKAVVVVEAVAVDITVPELSAADDVVETGGEDGTEERSEPVLSKERE